LKHNSTTRTKHVIFCLNLNISHNRIVQIVRGMNSQWYKSCNHLYVFQG